MNNLKKWLQNFALDKPPQTDLNVDPLVDVTNEETEEKFKGGIQEVILTLTQDALQNIKKRPDNSYKHLHTEKCIHA